MEIVRDTFFASFEKAVVDKVERMMGATLARAKSNPSPWFFLLNLWQKYTVPGILYGTESTPLSMGTINRLDSIQRDLVMKGLGLPPERERERETGTREGLRLERDGDQRETETRERPRQERDGDERERET